MFLKWFSSGVKAFLAPRLCFSIHFNYCMDGFFESQPKILCTGVQESISELLQKVDKMWKETCVD